MRSSKSTVEREEIEARPRVGAVGRPEDHRVAVAQGDRAAGEQGEPARLDGQRAATELGVRVLLLPLSSMRLEDGSVGSLAAQTEPA